MISEKVRIERFNNLIYPEPNTGCWLWGGAVSGNGYGRFWYDSKNSMAYRVSYLINKGPIPKGLFVCHHCDQPSCVNPDHLFLGTHKDNMNDRDSKGRNGYQKGEVNGNSKLKEAQIIEIRNSSLSHTELGIMYGVAPEHIAGIRKGKTWKHLKQPEMPTRSYRHEQEFPEMYLNKTNQ